MSRFLKTVLENAGFSPKEADVYLSLLKLGETTPPSIERDTAMKRGTIHVVLKSLVEKQLALTRPHESSSRLTLYKAVSPNAAFDRHEESNRQFRRALPEMMALNAELFSVPTIESFFELDGIRQVWNMLLDEEGDILTYFPTRHLLDVEGWLRNLERGHNLIQAFIDERLKQKKWLRGIVPYEPSKRTAKKLGIWEAQQYQLRCKVEGERTFRDLVLVPREACPYTSQRTICGSKYFFISYANNFATVRTSEQIVAEERISFLYDLNRARSDEDQLLSDEDRNYMLDYAAAIENEPS